MGLKRQSHERACGGAEVYGEDCHGGPEEILKKAMEKAWPETPPPDVHAGSQSESAQEPQEQTQWVSLSGLPSWGLTPLLPETLSDKALWASIMNKVTRARDDVPPLLERLRSLQLDEFLVNLQEQGFFSENHDMYHEKTEAEVSPGGAGNFAVSMACCLLAPSLGSTYNDRTACGKFGGGNLCDPCQWERGRRRVCCQRVGLRSGLLVVSACGSSQGLDRRQHQQVAVG